MNKLLVITALDVEISKEGVKITFNPPTETY